MINTRLKRLLLIHMDSEEKRPHDLPYNFLFSFNTHWPLSTNELEENFGGGFGIHEQIFFSHLITPLQTTSVELPV